MSPQSQVAVVADSTASLPAEFTSRYAISVVPVELVFQGRTYRDGVDLEPGEFYRLLEQAETLPTTSAPSPADFLAAFRSASERASSILCITPSQRLSATYSAACTAANLFQQDEPQVPLRIVDSKAAAGAEGLVVLAAARCAAAGGDLHRVCAAAQLVQERVRLVAFLETLHYAWKGGRVPKVAAWASSLLQVTPLMELRHGEVIFRGRPRTRQKATERLLQLVRDDMGDVPVRVNVLHAQAPEEAAALRERVRQGLHGVEAFVSEFTPVMGAHTGPGLLGLAYYSVEGEDALVGMSL